MNKIFTLMFLIFSSTLFAQNWDVIAEDVNYKIEQSKIVCKSTQGFDYEFTVLKFSNLTNDELSLSFNFERWYNGDYCHGCYDGDHNTIRELILPANASIEGTCNSSEDYLKIFDHSLTNDSKAWKSKLSDLVINKIEFTKN